MTPPAAGAGGALDRDGLPLEYRLRLADLHWPEPYLRGPLRVCAHDGQAWPCMVGMLLIAYGRLEYSWLQLSEIIDGCDDCFAAREATR